MDKLLRGFQVDDSSNPLLGASARVQILQKLGESLKNLPEISGPSGRPGQIAGQLPVDAIDYPATNLICRLPPGDEQRVPRLLGSLGRPTENPHPHLAI